MPRNVSGTYSLPLPPVVANTVIQAAWANTTENDVAQALTDSLDRNGRGGMVAPFRLVDGNASQPAFAFSAETGTGLFRASAGVMGVAVMGTQVGQWSATGYTGALAGPFNLTGDVTFTGRGLFADGTLAQPSISFTSDPDTGIYKPAVGRMTLVADAAEKLEVNFSSVLVRPSPTPSAPSMLIFANSTLGPGFALDILGSGVATDQAKIRLLNNAYTIERLSIYADSAGAVVGTPGALPLVLGTNNNPQLVIDASGNARFLGPLVTGANFWVGETAASAGTVGISGGQGASIVFWGTTSGGLGSMDLYASGQRQANVSSPGATANIWNIVGAVAGTRVAMNALGTDTNVGMQWATKGGGDYAYFGGLGGVHLQIICSVVGTTWLQLAGASGTAPNYPSISSNAAKITTAVANRFTGNLSTAGDLSQTMSQVSNIAHSFVDPGQAANNKIAEFLYAGGIIQARFLNDANTDARTIWAADGGVALGVKNVKLYTGANDLTMWMFSAGGGGGFGYVGIGAIQPAAQLAVYGLGQSSAAVFDPAFAAAGSTIYLDDTGTAAGSGGCVMFGAFAASAVGKHFASIKGFITDASANTAGELRFNLKNTSADTGSTQVLRLTADRGIYDSRDFPLGRDPGTTAANIPVGAMVFAQAVSVTGAGLSPGGTVALGAGVSLSWQAYTGGGAQSITTGTYRNIGAQSAGGAGMWMRVG
jgi:hypothetical protein